MIVKLKCNRNGELCLPLSMVGHIIVIKMVALPRFLYLFQSLPIFLTSFYLGVRGGNARALMYWRQGQPVEAPNSSPLWLNIEATAVQGSSLCTLLFPRQCLVVNLLVTALFWETPLSLQAAKYFCTYSYMP